MQRTIFNTPLVAPLLRAVSLAWLRAGGWTIEGALPPGVGKCVVIAAPHTSNWDLPYTLAVGFALRLQPYWMGKRSIFSFPFGALMRWLGGIPVDRSKANNLVAASAAELRASPDPVQLIVPPEGTRGATRQWKTGFYYIALGAEVPILMGYLDFRTRRTGLGPVFRPTGDVERDMAAIKAFYAPMKGRNATQFDVS